MCVCVCVCVCVFVRVYMCVCVCVCVQAGVHHICEYFISCIALAYVSLVSFVVFLLHCKDISFPQKRFFSQNNGSYQGERKCIPTTSKNSDSLLNTHSAGEDLKKKGGNEVERAGKAATISRYKKTCKQTWHAKLHSDILQA